MSLSTFFSQLDANLIAISGIFLGVWLTVHFSLFEATGDLHSIRNRAICVIANCQTNTEFIRLVDTLRQKSYVLVLEPKRRSKTLKNILILFAIASALAISHKPTATYFAFWPDANVFYFLYIFTLGAASSYLWTEVKYFREFRQLERDYPSSSLRPEELHITVL